MVTPCPKHPTPGAPIPSTPVLKGSPSEARWVQPPPMCSLITVFQQAPQLTVLMGLDVAQNVTLMSSTLLQLQFCSGRNTKPQNTCT